MPRYYFDLKQRDRMLPDPYGTDLPDETVARDHARHVVLELIRNAHARTRLWRLAVSDEDRRPCFELLFAAYDDSLSQLVPELRSSIETLCRKHGSLTDTILNVRTTMLQIKGTLARSDGRPYVAAENGRDCR